MGIRQFFCRVVVTLALVSIATALPSRRCGPAAVDIRDPPNLAGADPDLSWKAPPAGWILKPWNQVLTTNSQVAPLRNFQWDPTPVTAGDLNGPLNDLSSFQLPGNNTVYTSYGVATPSPDYVAVYDYRGTGILENATSQYSWLGWGCDGRGKDYYVSYSTASEASGTPAGIDIMSILDIGLDEETKVRVVEVLKLSQSEEIRKIANTFVANVQDGARRGMNRISKCDDECKSNKDLVGVLG